MKNSMQKAAIVANGAIHDIQTLSLLIKKHDYIIAVDGGLEHCHNMNVIPNLIIGDLDSAPQHLLKLYSQITILQFPQDKDETDLELAVKHAIKFSFNTITLFCTLGNRIDHTLGNLHLVRKYPQKVFIESETERVFVVDGNVEILSYPGQTLSLIPIGGPAEGVTTQGLQWELNNATLDTSFMSISNICLLDKVCINMKSGDLICCMYKKS